MSQTPRPLDYGCTDWRLSSQKAADLYNSGTRLWTKEDLQDIEQQLRQSYTMKRFSVRRIDGSIIQISNPMFQVQNPIWKPHVKYQEYWQLVGSQPKGPVGTYLCSYIVDWRNQTGLNFRELIPRSMQVFDRYQSVWQNSKTCEHLTALIEDVLGPNANAVKKILCFGLGDFCRTVPEWVTREHDPWDENSEIEEVRGCIIQHWMALTLARLCCCQDAENFQPLLLAQDPDYTKVAEDILTQKGFKIVGTHGAEGFAEIDDHSIIISPFTAAPVKQIIADLARPLLIICTDFNVFNDKKNPYTDADSPRTRQMWLDYDVHSLPSHVDNVEICSAFKGLYLFCRRQH